MLLVEKKSVICFDGVSTIISCVNTACVPSIRRARMYFALCSCVDIVHFFPAYSLIYISNFVTYRVTYILPTSVETSSFCAYIFSAFFRLHSNFPGQRVFSGSSVFLRFYFPFQRDVAKLRPRRISPSPSSIIYFYSFIYLCVYLYYIVYYF